MYYYITTGLKWGLNTVRNRIQISSFYMLTLPLWDNYFTIFLVSSNLWYPFPRSLITDDPASYLSGKIDPNRWILSHLPINSTNLISYTLPSLPLQWKKRLCPSLSPTLLAVVRISPICDFSRTVPAISFLFCIINFFIPDNSHGHMNIY